ncbi:MAG: hypothetical protein IJE10_01255 [Clostridia bacterium]|nr:hypothetical protein [Clostridia bacterium]
MQNLQQKLDFLLEKYSVDVKAELKNEAVVMNGTDIPLLAHRQERRFIEMKNMVNNGTLQGVSVMRTAHITAKDKDLYAALYKEFDLCQFILQRKIRSVMAVKNEVALNVIATTEDGVVCTLELAATLPSGLTVKDKHEVISQRGIACDIVVDAQLKQDSVYIFGEKNLAFTDVDFELYGLSTDEIALVRSAFVIARDNSVSEMLATDENLNALVMLAQKSAESGEREVLF